MGKTLFQKVWDRHTVGILPDGSTQLFVGTHLIHEVTSPQAFGMLRDLGLKVAFPSRTFATVDHIVPTDQRTEPFRDSLADAMIKELRKNCSEFGVTFFDIPSGKQGIVHIVGPEQGITQPGTTIACGDSHTSTHGAFGAVAFGIGTSQVRDVLATQTMALSPLKVRKIEVRGKLGPGVYAKDIILHIIRTLGVNGGTGYAYEYCGSTIEGLSLEERMTICNMSIEGGARAGMIGPDDVTFDYISSIDRQYAPRGVTLEAAIADWRTLITDDDNGFDRKIHIDASKLVPQVTWGTNPGMTVDITGVIPQPHEVPFATADDARRSLEYMGLTPGTPISEVPVDVVFIGSCTNGRIEDLRIAAKVMKGRKVAEGVQVLVVPGSEKVLAQAVAEGLDKIFSEAGAEWRQAGCSMCLAMNPDKLKPGQRSASTSNRNFEGRQGPGGRTHLVSPSMAAAAAVTGRFTDVRTLLA